MTVTDLLEKTRRSNPDLIKIATIFHRSGEIPADTYVIDLDILRTNAEKLFREAAKFHMKMYFCTKQIGENPLACRAIVNSGIRDGMATTVDAANSLHRHGFRVGHMGHMGQIPTSEITYVLREIRPEVITIYSVEKARQIAMVASQLGIVQDLLLKMVCNPRLEVEHLSRGTASGFTQEEALHAARRIREMQSVRIAGVTTYPAFAFSLITRKHHASRNFETMVEVVRRMEKELGIKIEQVNAAGENSVGTMELAARNGATHVEPGHAFTGTLPVNALVEDSPELPGIVYLTEVSHSFCGYPLAYGDGYMTND